GAAERVVPAATPAGVARAAGIAGSGLRPLAIGALQLLAALRGIDAALLHRLLRLRPARIAAGIEARFAATIILPVLGAADAVVELLSRLRIAVGHAVAVGGVVLEV